MITYQSNKSHKVKNKTSARKSSEMEKKARPLSGYTFFGRQMKGTFNQEIEKLEVKPKYVEFLGRKWKALSYEEQNVWKEKANEAFEKATNPIVPISSQDKTTNQIVPVSYRVSHVNLYGPFYLSVLLLLILFGPF